MSRPEATVDLCHVPTPEGVINRIRAQLDIPFGCVCLDPCCGDGSALKALSLDGEHYGVELELERAEAAKDNLKAVLPCAMEEARISNESFGLMLLNPPYADGTEGRLEAVFLERCTRYLVYDGILVLIIKGSMYWCVAKYLSQHYDVVGHWRFPYPYYEGPKLNFGQTVLIAKRKPFMRDRQIDRDSFYQTLRLDSASKFYGPELPAPTPAGHVNWKPTPVPKGITPKVFVSGRLSEADLEKLLAKSPVSKRMTLPSVIGCGQPPLPLKRGHIAQTLASGIVNGVYGSGNRLHVAKGSVIRHQTKELKELDDESIIEKTVESFTIRIRALTPAGVIYDMLGGTPVPEGASDGDDE